MANATGADRTSTGAGAGASPPAPGGITNYTRVEKVIPNPLHGYASWTYTWTLWWLDIVDYNNLVSDPTTASTQPLTNNRSYVVAEDAGLGIKQRSTNAKLNYNIQSVDFSTVVGPSGPSKTTNIIEGGIVIAEPYGVTFIDSLVARAAQQGTNHTEQPFLLELKWTAYDDKGNPIIHELEKYNKRFPIRILTIRLDVTTQGSTYNIRFVPANHIILRNEHNFVPTEVTITGSTPKELLDQLAEKINKSWQETANQAGASPNQIKFEVDPTCNTNFNLTKNISDANPLPITIDNSKLKITAPLGTNWRTIIDRIMQQTDFIQKQLVPQVPTSNQAVAINQNPLISYKITTAVKYLNSDPKQNRYPIESTYNITPYQVATSEHPFTPGKFVDYKALSIKQYDFLYSSKNRDVIDLKLNFEYTYFTHVNLSTENFSATRETPNANQQLANASRGARAALVTPNTLIRGANLFQDIQPWKYRLGGTPAADYGLNTEKNPSSLRAADALRSIYSKMSGDMIRVSLTIVGDPTLLKQDDWLFNTKTPKTTVTVNQQAFTADNNGYISMDSAELLVTVTIRTPIDQDPVTGLVTPDVTTSPSLFSGVYRLIKIDNKFSGGQFAQILDLARVPFQDYVNSSAAPAERVADNSSVGGIGQTYQSTTAIVAGNRPGV
jgi:hypothetical protein